MNHTYLSKEPIVLELNRVERLYTGGKLLDKWQGLTPEIDSSKSEEFLISTVEYIGPGKELIENGISRTKIDDGSFINLKKLIDQDANAFLGDKYAKICNNQSGVLARVGDSIVRLVIQVHPDAHDAKKYLGFPSGKAEAWYILDSREIDGVTPHLYAGFKTGVTKKIWRELFDKQDVPGMLDCMHRIEVKNGDVIVIEAGMPHAMGAGCLFLEIHEPCDYTIRLEKNYSVRPLKDNELHYGLGYDTMFEFFHYNTYSREAIEKKFLMKTNLVNHQTGGNLYDIITYDNIDRFCARKLVLNDNFKVPEFEGHFIMITAKGDVELSYDGGSKIVPQGRGVFVPAKVRGLSARGAGELIIAYPPKLSGIELI
ncbi:MAG: mannose-6-phosphate isomerase [Clostridia bacterium]